MDEHAGSPRELYDATAQAWVRTEPMTVSDFTGRPPALALCEPVTGLRVLDLGCGEGYCSRELRRRGAARVHGVDLSTSMIVAAITAERREPLGISYQQGDATDLGALGEGSFDRVVAMFLFNYLSVEQTERCLGGIYRVLAEGGQLVLAVPHPALAFLRAPLPPFFFDAGHHGYFDGRDRRFRGQIGKRDGSSLDVQMCHKTFEDYFVALRRAGFERLPILRELGVTPEILALDPSFFGPLVGVPLHLVLSVHR